MLSKNTVLALSLNYLEYAYAACISVDLAKERFRTILDVERMPPKAEIAVSALGAYHKNDLVRSIDPRYDGLNRLVFTIIHMGPRYKNYLNEFTFIKNERLGGGKSIYYKILKNHEIDHINRVLKQKREFKGLPDPNKEKPGKIKKRKMKRI